MNFYGHSYLSVFCGIIYGMLCDDRQILQERTYFREIIMENRIYGEKVNIDIDNTRELYNSRARRIQNGSISVNTSVLLGDQNPEYADEWNRIIRIMRVQIIFTRSILHRMR